MLRIEIDHLPDHLLDLIADRIVLRLKAASEDAREVDQDHLPEGLSRRTYLEAVRRGEIPAQKLGRRVVAKLADLRAWQEEHAVVARKGRPLPEGRDDGDLESIALANGYTIKK